MISTPDRQTAVALINEAVTVGARRAKACSELPFGGTSGRYNEWAEATS